MSRRARENMIPFKVHVQHTYSGGGGEPYSSDTSFLASTPPDDSKRKRSSSTKMGGNSSSANSGTVPLEGENCPKTGRSETETSQLE